MMTNWQSFILCQRLLLIKTKRDDLTMAKYSVTTTRGRRAMTRQTPGGRRYTFFANQWIRLNTDLPGHVDDIAYFKSDDLYEVVDGWHSNDVILSRTTESSGSETVEVVEPKKMKARK